MMSGQGPIFFNKKIKIRHPEHLLPSTSYFREHVIFVLRHNPPSQSGLHICITPNKKNLALNFWKTKRGRMSKIEKNSNI